MVPAAKMHQGPARRSRRDRSDQSHGSQGDHENKEAIISLDATSDERFEMSQSVADFRIRSMIVAPLLNTEGNAIGAIQIDTLQQAQSFRGERSRGIGCRYQSSRDHDRECPAARSSGSAKVGGTRLAISQTGPAGLLAQGDP